MSTTIDKKWKQELAEQIRAAREAAGLTQDELAKELDVSRQMVSNYEKSTNSAVPVIDVLARMSVVLEKRFRIKGLVVGVDETSPRLRTIPKQLRLDFEKAETYERAVITITPKQGQILINAKISA
jgi:transcriptional regulator with XRE-family HTH domain